MGLNCQHAPGNVLVFPHYAEDMIWGLAKGEFRHRELDGGGDDSGKDVISQFISLPPFQYWGQ